MNCTKVGSAMLAASLLSNAIATDARAEQVTVAFQAEVTQVLDSQGFLAGRVNVGDIVDGQYTYDTGTPDASSDPTTGSFTHPAPHGMAMVINDLGFQSQPGYGYRMTTFDVGTPGKHDVLTLSSFKNTFDVAVPNATSSYMELRFEDADGTALATDAAPASGPLLPGWPFTRIFLSSNRMGTSPAKFQVQGRVTYVETLAPGP